MVRRGTGRSKGAPGSPESPGLPGTAGGSTARNPEGDPGERASGVTREQGALRYAVARPAPPPTAATESVLNRGLKAGWEGDP